MTGPKNLQIRIGGKTYSSLEELPPETRQKFEQAVKQMRDSGLLDDKNRDGIPDRFETPLRVAGWLGKLTGNPQIKERIQQQLKAFNVTATPGSTSGRIPPRPPSAPALQAQARERTASRTPAQPVIQRSGGNDPHADTGLREFIRKLAIVSAVVIAGYLLLRLLGAA
jgi:hypothetical protein